MTTTAPSQPIDIYVRVSRVGGRENLISPDEQERRARELASQNGLEVGEVLKDLDESGGKWERPGLQTALARVRARESGGLIVAWLDRLSRDSEHAHRLVREITDAGGRIWAPDAPADWATPEGELQAGLLFAFATYVRKRAAAGFERAKQQAIERGIPVHKEPPIGYRSGPHRRLEPDPVAAPVIREVFRARARGARLGELIELLEDSGLETVRGSKFWKRATVLGMLKNRVYLGELHYGKPVRFSNLAAHEPLIDRTTWELAQGSAGVAPSRTFLLSGLLRCQACRHALHGTEDSRRCRRVYRCGIHHSTGECPAPARVKAETIEQVVVADVLRRLEPIKGARGRRDKVGALEKARKARDEARILLAQFSEPRVQAELEMELWLAGVRERRVNVSEAERRYAEAERQHELEAPTAMSWEQAWARMPFERRAAIVASQYDCIALGRHADAAVIYPVGTGSVDLPRRGVRGGELRPFDDRLPEGAGILVLEPIAKDGRGSH